MFTFSIDDQKGHRKYIFVCSFSLGQTCGQAESIRDILYCQNWRSQNLGIAKIGLILYFWQEGNVRWCQELPGGSKMPDGAKTGGSNKTMGMYTGISALCYHIYTGAAAVLMLMN